MMARELALTPPTTILCEFGPNVKWAGVVMRGGPPFTRGAVSTYECDPLSMPLRRMTR